jgi:hypothetical protein
MKSSLIFLAYCIPITCEGRFVTAAILVSDIEDVLEASTASFLTI